MKYNKYTKSISFNILASFLGVIFGITTIIFCVSYYFTLKMVEKNAVEFTGQFVQEVSTQIESYVSYMENIADFVTSDSDIKQYIQDEQNINHNKVSNKLNTILNVRSDISNIILFKNNGDITVGKDYIKINPNVEYKQQKWYTEAISAKGKPVISSSHVQNIIQDDYRWVISMSRAVFNDKNEIQGVLLVDLKYNVISDLCKNIRLGKSGYVFILDGGGEIVYHPFQQLIYSNIKKESIDDIAKNQNKQFTIKDPYTTKNYTVVTTDKANWKVAGVYDIHEIMANKITIRFVYLYIFIIFSGIGVFLSITISNKLTQPIKKLIGGMKRVETGDFTSKVNITTQDEIGHLAHVFNMMVEQIDNLVEQGKKNMEDRRRLEIKMLQAQINPHFLYNTLDSIVWLAEMGNSEEVVEMTMALSKLFRTSISRNDELIPFYLEIDNIKSYLTIQKIRYKNNLNFEIDIPEELLDSLVIKLLLQPIVENAIYHGIKKKDGGGTIKITGYDAGSDFIIGIEDDGVGMTEVELDDILKPKQREKGGIGIVNVNDRIKLYFGDEYGLSYSSELGKGTKVIIFLPKIERQGGN